MMPWKSTRIRRYWIWKWGLKVWMFQLLYIKNHNPFHISMQENLSYGPTALRTHPSPSYPHAVHYWLTYEEDDTSSLTLENYSSGDDILACHLPSIAEEEDNDMKAHVPTVSLDDDFWMEEHVPERHMCIHQNAQHDLCPYPCPYYLNQLHHHSGRWHAIHRSQWHHRFPRCYGICQWPWSTQPGRYTWTLKEMQIMTYKICLIKTLPPPVICCWSRTHLWIVTHLCAKWIYTGTSFEPYPKVLLQNLGHCSSDIDTVHFGNIKKNTVPVTLILYIFRILRRTLFWWHWILCEIYWKKCSSVKIWYCTRTLKTVPVQTFDLWISKNPWTLFQCKTLMLYGYPSKLWKLLMKWALNIYSGTQKALYKPAVWICMTTYIWYSCGHKTLKLDYVEKH